MRGTGAEPAMLHVHRGLCTAQSPLRRGTTIIRRPVTLMSSCRTQLTRMVNEIIIRQASARDFDVVADVMFDAVRHGRSKYTEEQRSAWVPRPRSGPDWNNRLESQTIFVAELEAELIGFMSLAANGYIDFAYVRPAAQGTGVFRRLYESIEKMAFQTGVEHLRVHASLMAQPAFRAMGFAITKNETVEIGGQLLDRFAMQKPVADAQSIG